MPGSASSPGYPVSKIQTYLKDLTFQRKTIKKYDNCCDRKEGTYSLLRNEYRRGRNEEGAYHELKSIVFLSIVCCPTGTASP